MDDKRSIPDVLASLSNIEQVIGRRKPLFFLDFDGTLAPLAPRPELAEMLSETRELVGALSLQTVVCVMSGRGLTDLRQKVRLADVYYGADHGFRIVGPPASGIEFDVGPSDPHELEAASYELERRLRAVEGVIIEAKGASLAVHYRLVVESDRPTVRGVVEEIAKAAPSLRLISGKLVHEPIPEANWDKGKAMLWLLRRLRFGRRDSCPICLGDDLTDEDMFAATRDWGVSVVVSDHGPHTRADYGLRDPGEVAAFLRHFVDYLRYRTVPRGVN